MTPPRFFGLLLIPALLVAGILWLGASGDKADKPEATETSAAHANWLTDFSVAKQQSADNGKPILLFFTGSDWCPPCIRMKERVLNTEEFADFAKEHLVLVELDFPRRTEIDADLEKRNRAMADEYEIAGFPTFILVQEEGKELARFSGFRRGGIASLIQWVEDAQTAQAH